MGTPRVHWLVHRLDSGEFMEGTGFPGDLRDGVFAGGEAWLLGSYGLCRVTLDPPTVDDVVKLGIGKHQHRLFRLSDSLLGIGRIGGETLLVVDAGNGSVRKRIRGPAPDAVLSDREHSVILCSFAAGAARRLNLATLRATPAEALPTGLAPLDLGETLVALTGAEEPWGRVVETDHIVANTILDGLGPLGRFVRRIARVPPTESPVAWRIRPTELVELARSDLRVRRRVSGADGLGELLGVDRDDRLIATADWGLALVDRECLEVVERFEDERAAGPACWVPEAGAVVFLRHYLAVSPGRGFDPVPENLLVVRW